MKLGFKVVFPHGAQLTSCRMRGDRDYADSKKACCIYGVGRVAVPNNGYGPLAVFGDYSKAKEFANNEVYNALPMGKEKIFLCAYQESERKFLETPLLGKKTNGDFDTLESMGTEFADQVILILEIK